MAAPLLSLKDIRLTYGGTPLLAGAELMVQDGARIALVGRNGSGKSTFLKIAAGLVEPDTGERTVRSGTTFRYLEQDPDFSAFDTAQSVVMDGLSPTDDPGDVGRLLADLNINPTAAPGPLSGGEKRRVAIARALAPSPEVLLLDEPTNHVDLETIVWLEAEIARRRCALVLISHDRRFLQNLTSETVWIDRGETRHVNEGFSGFEAWRDKVIDEEELAAHKLDRKIVREEHWLRYGVTARRKRNVRRLAALKSLRHERAERRGPQGIIDVTASESDASGKKVIDVSDLTFSYPDKAIVSALDLKVMRGDRLGVVGPNGAGKTTLLRLLLGHIAPQSGDVIHGTKLEIIALDQERHGLKDTTRLMDALTEGRGDQITVGGQPRHALSYLKDFLFTPEQARQPIGALSGGERGRLALAIALAKPSNLLVLDEPTNDLDLETLDVLEETLAHYQGTLLLVSHDRDFLDRVVTSVLTPVPEEGIGRWRDFPGGYQDMSRQRQSAAKTTRADSKPAKKSPTSPAKKKASSKLSYKDKHALETLPAEIERLTASIEMHEAALADPHLFTKDPAAYDRAQKGLAADSAARQAAEDQWLELEIKREDIEGS
ncbi:MAG: ATP-binding cassette domain-containing protein [Pseudomonadota bacterium]